MSGGETAGIAELANKISKELFEWFKWERVPVLDQNFRCVKQEKHAPRKKTDHTHPVDVVFHYVDPYLGRRVLLNTDLKSYAKGSISASAIRSALRSLAQTIDCACVSEEWSGRYDLTNESLDVRGMLFVYNNYHLVHHDLPHVPWFALREVYEAARQQYVERSGGFLVNGYSEWLKRYLFARIAHPVYRDISDVVSDNPPASDSFAGKLRVKFMVVVLRGEFHEADLPAAAECQTARQAL